MKTSQSKFQQIPKLYQQGRLSEAERLCEELIKLQPNHFDALHLLGVIACKTGRAEQAVRLLTKAANIEPAIADVHNNLGAALKDLKRFEDALKSYDRAIQLNPQYFEAHINRGNVLLLLTRPDKSLESYNRAKALKANSPKALIGCGNALYYLKRYNDAIATYKTVIAINDRLEDAWNGYGNALFELELFDDALKAYDQAVALNARLDTAWLGRGNTLFALTLYDQALLSYDKALTLAPEPALALNGRGNALVALVRYNEALIAFNDALSLEPSLEGAYVGRGNAYFGIKQLDKAIASYENAIDLKPESAKAWFGLGKVFDDLKRNVEAASAYDRAAAASADLIGLEGARFLSKLNICDWTEYDHARTEAIESVKNGKANVDPFAYLSIDGAASHQLWCARLWAGKHMPPSANPLWQNEVYNHDKIRVAYLSADFREHAVSYLLAGVFEQHDRDRFYTTAVSLQRDDSSRLQQRLKKAFDRYIDVSEKSDLEIAQLLCDLEVDIVVDLMGYTTESRTSIFRASRVRFRSTILGSLAQSELRISITLSPMKQLFRHHNRRIMQKKLFGCQIATCRMMQ